MTPTRIHEIREACEKATPAEWTYEVSRAEFADGSKVAYVYDSKSERGVVAYEVAEPDAAFIAIARTALPEALREIERLRGLVERACDALGGGSRSDLFAIADELRKEATNV